jgi:fructose-1,6-bisphosphatase
MDWYISNLLNNKHPNHKELNQHLFQEYSKTYDELIKFEQAGKPYTVYDLHSKSTNKSSPTTLFKFAESIIDKIIVSVQQSRSIRNHLLNSKGVELQPGEG